MVGKQYISQRSRRAAQRREALSRNNLELAYKKNGYFDGKIFYAPDRVTHTFLDGDDVVVLHFDLNRNSLYFKGHRVTSLKGHDRLSGYLVLFKKCLQDNPRTRKFVRPFDAVMAALSETD